MVMKTVRVIGRKRLRHTISQHTAFQCLTGMIPHVLNADGQHVAFGQENLKRMRTTASVKLKLFPDSTVGFSVYLFCVYSIWQSWRTWSVTLPVSRYHRE